jgi:alpha-ketoglutarate-dependent taurine dioxygenase
MRIFPKGWIRFAVVPVVALLLPACGYSLSGRGNNLPSDWRIIAVPLFVNHSTVPDVETPVVRTHPVTKRKGLFINEAHTSALVGLPKEEGDALLAELYQHIIKPEFVYTHHWQAGDLLLWDNCSVQHKATFDYDLPLRRLMHRTTVRGTAAV